jgi:phosphate starvation-inducible PhoH-like protein
VRKTTNAVVLYETPKKKFTTHDLKNIHPKNYSQERVFESYQDGNSIVLTGSAGTGKTFLAMYLALQEILSGESQFKKLIIIRSTAPLREIGHLPGTVEEKIAIYEMPYKQLCDDIFTRHGQYEKLKESGIIEFISTSFIRGVTFKDCIVIVEEAQNLNWAEISSCITRAGNNCKYFICGDTKQTDLLYRKNDESGLGKFIAISKMIPSFRCVNFTMEDIVRSGLVKEFLIAESRYDEIGSERN